jgi:HSP20 family protein
MTRISVYDPFAEVFPSIFRSMFSAAPEPKTSAASAAPAVPTVAMRVDVIETAEGYVLRADLPGVPKEAIQIDIDANRVTLRAQPVRDAEPKPEGRVLRSERFDGHYARSFALTDEIDESRATARVDNGVLELTLPRKTGAGPTRLTVQ